MAETDPVGAAGNWERTIIEKLARAALDEQRRARHWGIFFKTLTFIYLFILMFAAFGWLGGREVAMTGNHSALVELNGVIAADAYANADAINQGLQDAFADKSTKGVILRINSPGGSPVQAGTINTEIGRLREKYPDIPIYAVIEDICASGGYYVAVAADQIYVDKASIVGSIGVLMDGFGFTGTMEKLGVERRLLTAGEKGISRPILATRSLPARIRQAHAGGDPPAVCRSGAQGARQAPEGSAGRFFRPGVDRPEKHRPGPDRRIRER